MILSHIEATNLLEIYVHVVKPEDEIDIPVHGELRNATIYSSDTNPRSKYGAYSRSTSHIISYNKFLHGFNKSKLFSILPLVTII